MGPDFLKRSMLKGDVVKSQIHGLMTGLVLTLLAFANSSVCIANRPELRVRAATTNVKITVGLYAAEDSAAVIRYSASLYDASNSVLLDSLVSDSVNVIDFSVVAASVPAVGGTIPLQYDLDQNFPNPFNPSTIIRFSIQGADDVKLSVYDILGRTVATLVDQWLSPGSYQVNWSPNVASGVYFYRLQSGKFSETKKMIALDGSGHAAGASRLTVLGKASTNGAEELLPPLRKMQSGSGYILHIYSLSGVTFPQVNTLAISIPPLSGDTTIQVYATRTGAHVYLDSTQQFIEGFGAANIVGWRPDMTYGQIQTAFGTGPDQLGFTILRLRIPPDSTQFRINVPSAKSADSLAVQVIASPWTPPGWMKSNNNIIGGTLNASNYAAFAAHLKSFADTMAKYGAPIFAISVQNEPDANVNYESCYWNATQFLNFMKNNAPAVGVPVFMPEAMGFNHVYSDATLNDPAACANVAFVGGHLYGNTNKNYPLALSKGRELWMTEYLSTDTSWSAVLTTAKQINDCMNAQYSAYVWWYIVRFYGPIGENGNSPTKRGYVMSQYSKFVRPGFLRVSAQANPQTNIYVTAYKNNSKVVIVALNMGSSSVSQTFVIPHGSATAYTPYVTSSSKNCAQETAITVSSLTFTAVLDPSSVTTFVSN
jgi:glucuronoarabinoxylan endo-1,4-beta-xylanase